MITPVTINVNYIFCDQNEPLRLVTQTGRCTNGAYEELVNTHFTRLIADTVRQVPWSVCHCGESDTNWYYVTLMYSVKTEFPSQKREIEMSGSFQPYCGNCDTLQMLNMTLLSAQCRQIGQSIVLSMNVFTEQKPGSLEEEIVVQVIPEPQPYELGASL